MSYCGDRRIFGMAVVTASSSASLTLAQLIARSCARRSTEKFSIAAFRSDSHNCPSHLSLPSENSKPKISLHATGTDSPPCALELDFNEAAAKLESIFNLSPIPVADPVKRRRQRRKEKEENIAKPVVRNLLKKPRLTLHKRRELKELREAGKAETKNENEKIEELVREYSSGTDIGAMDWKKMKIPPVLASAEHEWLFDLIQPMKNLLHEKENLRNAIGREPNDIELANSLQMGVALLKKQLTIGHAARNKLIKHNLRLVLFVVKKYFQDNRRFHDLCQEGAKGLIVAIDRFEPKRKAKLSTYSLFWIRHAVVRSLTVSSFTRVSFGLEAVRAEIQKTKLELLVKLQRQPTEEEVIEKTGITQQRYLEVMRASAHVASLNTKHVESGEEWIKSITEDEGDVNGRQRAMSRLALDDVLDSLKPKESLVIRQRYGLDGKGDRTLGEIAGNLSISREMVRKYEVKALMKLKHPTRVDYLRRCVVSSSNSL